MKSADSFLLVIDVQEKLVAAIDGVKEVVANISRLMTAANRLEVPVLLTEHYPKGIGSTVSELSGLADPDAVMEKIHFSALEETRCGRYFDNSKRRKVVVCGTETHVCVLQTTLSLKMAGFDPYLVVNATSSRYPVDREIAIGRMKEAGVTLVTTEMVLFEWLERGDTPEFRAILPLIKERPPRE